MGTWETFEHTADIGLRVRGATLDDLFAEAGKALFHILIENADEIQPVEMVEFQVHSEDHAYLLVDWLRELLYLFDAEHMVLCQFEVRVNERRPVLSAHCRGEKLDWDRHRPGVEVKAITYHNLKLEKQGDEWIAEVILDI